MDCLHILGLLCVVSLLPLISCRPKDPSKEHHKEHNQHLLLRTPETSLSCLYDNVTYTAGHTFRPDACTLCHCPKHGGRAKCSVEDCRYMPNCVRWKQPTAHDNQCCGTCLTFGCTHSDGKIYSPGETVFVGECEECFCPDSGGRTICTQVACPRIQCVDAVQGPCCSVCPNGNNCWYKGEILNAGEVVQDGCRQCKCPDDPPPHWFDIHKLQATCSMDAC